MVGISLASQRRRSQTLFTTLICSVLFFSLALETVSTRATAVGPVAALVPAPAIAPVPVHAHVLAPAPAPKVLTAHEKVVNSLRAAGHYGAIAGLLDSLRANNIIKTGMTLIAPDDNAFSSIPMNSTDYLLTLLSYHLTTKVYSYQALTSLLPGTKLQASAANVVIVVTSNAKDAYKLDDSLIVDPDIFVDNTISVHGIDSVLNTAKYNVGVVAPEAAPAPAQAAPAISPGPPAPPGSETDDPNLSPDSASLPNDASITKTGLGVYGVVMVLWITLVSLSS